ncbi:MAG: cation transporter [Gammaproteobacteria bacterium]|nr:cation transporter [Gammaproteobacteria bacterium]
MHITNTLEFPPLLAKIYKKAVVYEWISLFYMASVVFFLYLVMGNSQTMKAVFFEDSLSLIPPLMFLISSHFIKKPANKNFPYGFHKITNICHLASALTLCAVGLSLMIDSTRVLLKHEHPDISIIVIGDQIIWLGYLMMVALLWKSIPNTFLGRVKYRMSLQLYDKILFTDAKMNKADWLTGFASIVGILGIGMGLWWMDSAVAILISFDILYDGYHTLKKAILDLLDEMPHTLARDKTDPIIHQAAKYIADQSWVKESAVRFRDEGHIFFGEIFIVPNTDKNLIDHANKLEAEIKQLNWRLHDVVIVLT